MIQEKVLPKIMDRIRKCLNLADTTKGATEDEAIAAMAAAKRLMAEHNLNMSDIELKEEVSAGAVSVMSTSKRKSHVAWEWLLARVVDILFGTKHYFTSVPCNNSKGWDRRVMFIGVGQDSQISAESYSILVNIVFKMCYAGGYKGKAFTSYGLGVAMTLIERARDQVKDLTEVQENSNRGIIVIKSAVINTFMNSLSLHAARRSRTSVNSEAYSKGIRDGRNINLSFRSALR